MATREKCLKGMIFNIQKFSLHDGNGIRTVVFFKGCPLRCKWCSNPESQNAETETMYESENVNKKIGELKTVDEVVEICLQDLDFYLESGGGVTLSGGEPLMQSEFCISLLKSLKQKNIHTAMETTGFATEKIFTSVLPFVDLILFDMKHWDERKHIEATGVSNKLILCNMTTAIQSGKDVLPRLPVIPDYNNSITDAENFSKQLHKVGASKIQLLPFHQFGEKKYEMLRRTYEYSDKNALHEEDLETFKQTFFDNGIKAFF